MAVQNVPLAEVLQSFHHGAPMLFLGAGPSMVVGGPSWAKLEDEIRKKFPVETDSGAMTDFFSLCNEICEYQDKRRELEELIERELSKVVCPPWVGELLTLPWSAIFTTNYDLIPEQARTLGNATGRDLQIYAGGEMPPKITAGVIPVYKLMGSANLKFPAPGAMVLSATDLRIRSAERLKYMQRMKDGLDTASALIIIGSSLTDEIVFDLLQEMRQTSPTIPSAPVYLVKPSSPSEKVARRMERFGVGWAKGSVEEFLAGVQALGPIDKRSVGREIRVGGLQFFLSDDLISQQAYAGTIIDLLYPGAECETHTEFFLRSVYSKEALDKKWDFQREVIRVRSARHPDAVRMPPGHPVKQLLQDTQGGLAPRVLITGPAGSAKTMTCLRLAHDWVVAGGLVLMIDGHRSWSDATSIANLVENVSQEIKSQAIVLDRQAATNFLIILDNWADKAYGARDISVELKLRGIDRFSVIVVGHEHELHPGDEEIFDEQWALDPLISDDEKTRLRLFVEQHFPQTSPAFTESVLTHPGNSTFWAVMYELVTASRQPLEQSVIKEYDRLNDWQHDLVARVATFQTLHIPLVEQLAWRSCAGRKADEVLREIEAGKLRGILYIQEGYPFRTVECMNTMVAHTIVQQRVRPALPPAQLVIRVIPLVRNTPEEAAYFRESLLKLSRDKDPLVPVASRADILAQAARHLDHRALWHHYGKALKIMGQYEEAERALKTALERKFFGERTGIIHHSLGELYLAWSTKLLGSNELESRRLGALARIHYEQCDRHPSSYYDLAMAKLLCLESNFESEPGRKKLKLMDAMHVCLLGRYGAAAEERDYFDTVSRAVFKELAKSSLDLDDAHQLATRFSSPRGFEYLARAGLKGRPLPKLPRSELESVRGVVMEGLRVDSKDPALNDLAARIHYLLEPTDKDSQFKYIDRLTASFPVSYLCLLRARTYASCEDYSEADRQMSFARLKDEGYVVPREMRSEFVIRQKDGAPRPYYVEGHAGAPWVNIKIRRLEIPGATPNSYLHLITTIKGFMPVSQGAIGEQVVYQAV